MDELNGRLAALEDAIGYHFADRALLLTALTHTSFVKGDGKHAEYNERMEFLGDAVLELCVSDYLYAAHPDSDEGVLTKTRARLVCEQALFAAAQSFGLPACIRLGHGEERTGGQQKPSIVSDALEAVLGAVYLDGGIEQARTLIVSHLIRRLEDAAVDALDRDYKTQLQELVQQKHTGRISYVLTGSTGPEHRKTFSMEAQLDGKTVGCGSGSTKQRAEQEAARRALIALTEPRKQEK